MGRRHQKLLNIVVFDGLHTLDSLATTVLATEIVYRHTFDIAQFCHGNNRVFAWNQILHRDIEFVKTDRGSSVIAILFGYSQNLSADHAKKNLSVCENGF